jgi:hypothetical protein
LNSTFTGVDFADIGATIWRAEPLLVPASIEVPPVMEAVRIISVGAEPISVAIMASVMAPAPILDLLDGTSTINGGTQPCRSAEGRGLSAIRYQRASREHGGGDIDEKQFSH